jgi:hypothetical protein
VSTTAKRKRATEAAHRPAKHRRNFRHDELVAGDLFSGFGGLTRGMEMAGVTTIIAANHNPYKVEIHEANHPDAEHFVCDLVDPDAGDYYSPKELPRVDWLSAGISCVHHSGANAQKAVASGELAVQLPRRRVRGARHPLRTGSGHRHLCAAVRRRAPPEDHADRVHDRARRVGEGPSGQPADR